MALGARAAKVEFSGFVEWAIHDPDLNHVLSPEMVVRAYVRPAWEDAEEGLVGGYEQEGWLHDGARWVCTGRALDLSRSEDLAERIQAHLMATDFGELRSLLQRPPDVSVWNHLGLYLSMLNERDDFASAIVPYITDHVEDWPVALRKARVGAPEIVPLLGVAVVNDPAELGDARPAGVEVHSAEALLELLEHPVAQTLEVLHTFGEQMTLELARALALARLPRLEVLRMHHDTWQPGAGQVFERTPWLEGLRELHVGGHGLGPTWVNLFGGEELERVTYPGDDADVSDLLGSLSRLRALSAFSSNADILAAILSSPAPLALEALWLVEGVEEDALMALAQTNRLPELETLVASSPRGMLRAARALARSASLPKLKNIVLL